MNKIFFFKNVSAHHVKVSHGGFVGLPSLTGLTGLNRNFAIQLARALGLPPEALQPAGALLAVEGYHLHEGYKKGHKSGQAVYEAIPAAWASFTAHIALEVSAVTPEAQGKLAGAALTELAQGLLGEMSLCKGSLNNVARPVDLATAGTARDVSPRQQVLQLLPAGSLVVRDYGYLVVAMRQAKLPLMEGLVASTLRHANRPKRYRKFFESEEVGAHDAVLAPVMNGFLKLEQSPSSQSIRPDALGASSGSCVASPAFTVTRLQQAASLRLRVRNNNEPMYAFWKEYLHHEGYFCAAEE